MEPSLYKGYPSLVTLGKRYKIPFIGFTTNGQLLTRSSIRLMIEAGLDEITLSSHGIKKDTYEKLMKGASFETYHRSLANVVKLKREIGTKKPAIRINYTVNPDNLSELIDFFDRFGEYDITTLQVRPMIDFGYTEYQHRSLRDNIQKYNDVMGFLISQCRRRNIFLLTNKVDPEYDKSNKYAVVYEKAIMRYLGPDQVWKDDFDFRSETYREHISRTGYRRDLLKYVLQGDASLLKKTSLASSQLF